MFGIVAVWVIFVLDTVRVYGLELEKDLQRSTYLKPSDPTTEWLGDVR